MYDNWQNLMIRFKMFVTLLFVKTAFSTCLTGQTLNNCCSYNMYCNN